MVGFGYDIHRLQEGESLILGGVEIDSPVGTLAHSDGDVLLHAVCDALFGAVGMGDIGEHFPDTDARYKNISSLLLLEETIHILSESEYSVVNLDATLVLERPKILPYKPAMRRNIAERIRLPIERVSIKATTNEGLGFIGASGGVTAYCVCLVEKS